MHEIRAALVLVPPLLADLIRQVLQGRALPVRIVGDLTDPETVVQDLAGLNFDLVLIGSPGVAHLAAASLSEKTRVLTLSPDLRELHGPSTGEHGLFSADSLADILTRLHHDLDPGAQP